MGYENFWVRQKIGGYGEVVPVDLSINLKEDGNQAAFNFSNGPGIDRVVIREVGIATEWYGQNASQNENMQEEETARNRNQPCLGKSLPPPSKIKSRKKVAERTDRKAEINTISPRF
ncbi:hypothetical protein DPMN_166584 [Dreissena polymorpha]|uniref:Uncharacterized protein n=1 Tax=Dreissena polymorpha TaxID=45954 RepID=A0A9D4EXA9_DREPO|nr:hypothetical protein DPMN_166584 [Dreissena polymorpha]